MNNRSLILIAATALFASNSFAGKPTKGEDGPYLGNGFPSGPHFNLNIHGKNDNFTCPDAEYVWTITGPELDPDEFDGIGLGDEVIASACPDGYVCSQGEQVFGNVINIPRDGTDVQINIESGSKGPKSKVTASELEVTDWCASIGGDNDAASFRLPSDPDGYAVYARVTGKPTEGQSFDIFGRSFSSVEVECDPADASDNCNANDTYDLLLLGVVNESEGSFVPMPDGSFDRVDTNDGRGGKGVKNAVDISGLFEFTGSVCYVYSDDPACTGDTPCDATDYCCATDANDGTYVIGFDGVSCQDKIESGYFAYLDDENVTQYDCTIQNTASITWIDQTFYCRDYEDAWIFNIADFVDVLFDINNNGSYNVQLRFYPLPLQEGKVK
jgi:hypothetical protein